MAVLSDIAEVQIVRNATEFQIARNAYSLYQIKVVPGIMLEFYR